MSEQHNLAFGQIYLACKISPWYLTEKKGKLSCKASKPFPSNQCVLCSVWLLTYSRFTVIRVIWLLWKILKGLGVSLTASSGSSFFQPPHLWIHGEFCLSIHGWLCNIPNYLLKGRSPTRTRWPIVVWTPPSPRPLMKCTAFEGICASIRKMLPINAVSLWSHNITLQAVQFQTAFPL